MSVNLELYRIFAAVMREKSFSGAAAALYISQPAVSQAIHQLESSLGVQLFIRSSRGVSPTREGEVLSGYIFSALDLVSAGEERLLKINSLSGGELHIGASDTVSKWYLLPVMERFHELYPEVELKITNRTSSETIALLQQGKLDIGFVNMPISAENVIFEKCMDIHDVFVAGERFSHMKNHTITLEELSHQPLIMLERASNSRRCVDRHFFAHGIVLKPEIELGAHDLLVDYAGIGLGIACVVREFSPKEADSGLFSIKLSKPIPPRSLAACFLEGVVISPAARRFVELVKGSTSV